MYLIRLDDASEYWNRENWHRIHNLLKQYSISPLVAIIPQNKDPKLLCYEQDNSFTETIRGWIDEGWVPALHGLNHVISSDNPGINPMNEKSEFAGIPLEEQKKKIRQGYQILIEKGIFAKVFVAPWHTFDWNTVRAIREETDIRIISDTIAKDIYYKNGFFFIPQQTGEVRLLKAPIITFCYHPNTMTEEQFRTLECFLLKHYSKFIKYENIQMKKRKYGLDDILLRFLYYCRKRILRKIQVLPYLSQKKRDSNFRFH